MLIRIGSIGENLIPATTFSYPQIGRSGDLDASYFPAFSSSIATRFAPLLPRASQGQRKITTMVRYFDLHGSSVTEMMMGK